MSGGSADFPNMPLSGGGRTSKGAGDDKARMIRHPLDLLHDL